MRVLYGLLQAASALGDRLPANFRDARAFAVVQRFFQQIVLGLFQTLERAGMMRQRLLGLRLRAPAAVPAALPVRRCGRAARRCALRSSVPSRSVPRCARRGLPRTASRRAASAAQALDNVVLRRHARFQLRQSVPWTCSRSPASCCSRARSSSPRCRLKRMRFSARSSSSAACPIRFWFCRSSVSSSYVRRSSRCCSASSAPTDWACLRLVRRDFAQEPLEPSASASSSRALLASTCRSRPRICSRSSA